MIGSMEAIAGLADGINDRGLALSLAFGGRQVVGSGFGIPVILRYVLEICADTAEAIEVLRRVPSHQAYNVTLLDGKGTHSTVLVAPDRPTIVTRELTTTNHQLDVEWHEQARSSRTVERKRFLDQLLARRKLKRPSWSRLSWPHPFSAPTMHVASARSIRRLTLRSRAA